MASLYAKRKKEEEQTRRDERKNKSVAIADTTQKKVPTVDLGSGANSSVTNTVNESKPLPRLRKNTTTAEERQAKRDNFAEKWNNYRNPETEFANTTDEQFVKAAVDSNKKLNKTDEKRAKQIVKDQKSNYGINPNDVFEYGQDYVDNKRKQARESLTPEERKYQDYLQALDNQTSNTYGFVRGMAKAIPGLDRYINKKQDELIANGELNRDDIIRTEKEQGEMTQKQNPLADLSGQTVGNAAMYSFANAALEPVEGFDKVAKSLKLGEKGTEAVANLLRGQTADTLLSTLPKIVDDVKAGEDAKTVAKNALKDEAVNLGFNLVPEVLGQLGNVGKKSNAIELSDETKDWIKDVAPDKNGIGNSFEQNQIWLNNKSQKGNTITDTVEREMLSPDVTKTHSPQELDTMNQYINSADYEMEQYIKNVRNNNYKSQKPYVIKEQVAPRMAEDIKKLYGVDVSDYKLDLEASAIRHIDIDHGVMGKADHSMADDISRSRVEYIIDNYDFVEKGQSTGMYKEFNKETNKSQRAKTVVFSKKVDGKYYVVEALPDTSKKTMHIVSTYTDSSQGIKKGAAPLVNVQDTPSLNAQDVNSITPNQSIGQNVNTVNATINNNYQNNIPQLGKNDVSQHYNTLKNSSEFATSEGQAIIESAKDAGAFNKSVSGVKQTLDDNIQIVNQRYDTAKNSDMVKNVESNISGLKDGVENRKATMEQALKEFSENPDKVREEVLHGVWTEGGKDIDKSALVLRDAIQNGADATEINMILRNQSARLTNAGRELRAVQDNYAGTKEGTLMQGARYLNDRADSVLKNKKTANQIESMAESCLKGDYASLTAKLKMDDTAMQNVKNAVNSGASKEEISKMLATYKEVGVTEISQDTLKKIDDIYNQIEQSGFGINSKERADLEAQAYAVLAQDIGGKNPLRICGTVGDTLQCLAILKHIYVTC